MRELVEKHILGIGEWKHPSAPNGVLTISKEYAQKLVDNFNKTPFVPVLRGHVPNSEAEKDSNLVITKNIKGLRLGDDGVHATFEVDKKELDFYNDVSASIDPDYEDHESGLKLGPVLKHIAFVLDPYMKKLKTFVPLSENEDYIIYLSEIKMADKNPTNEVPEETVVPAEETTEPAKVEEVVPEGEKPVIPEVQEVVPVSEQPEVVEPAVEPEKAEPEVEGEPVETVLASDDARQKLANYDRMAIELAEAKKEKRQSLAESFYSELLLEGKVLPSMKNEIIHLTSQGETMINLGESEVSLSDMVKNLFKKMPVLVNLKERGFDLEQGKKANVDLSESTIEDVRKSFFERKPQATEEEFNKFLEENQDKYKKYEN